MPQTPPPVYRARHPALRGIALVNGSDGEHQFTVNLDTNECNCTHGQAFSFAEKRWVSRPWCAHKMRALASLIESSDDPSLYDEYEYQLGKRYNPFVAISAFHKELRRGDVEKAKYWATVLIAHRGRHGVITYMRNIVFEETRDLALLDCILKASAEGRHVKASTMYNIVARFAAAPKKWQLPGRLEIFLDEMRGYQSLVSEYGTDVAKAHSIIPVSETKALTRALLDGFASGNRAMVQKGLKGLYKSKNAQGNEDGHFKLRVEIYNHLIDVFNEEHPNKFEVDHEYTLRLINLLTTRNKNYGAPGYHEINALADALTGETDAGGDFQPATIDCKRILGNPSWYRPPLADLRRIPQYAHDNHTWEGKAKMKQYGAIELRPGAKQDNIDFRYCGAYLGVAWRYLAYRQHGTTECQWGDVKWIPKWLWAHTNNMFY